MVLKLLKLAQFWKHFKGVRLFILSRNWFLYRLPLFPERILAQSGQDLFRDKMARKNYTNLVTYSNMDLEAYKYSFSRKSEYPPFPHLRTSPYEKVGLLNTGEVLVR